MTDAAEKILREAMKLPPEVRSRIGQQLLDSAAVANDDMDPEELAALQESLDESERQFAAGEGREFFSAIAELRAKS